MRYLGLIGVLFIVGCASEPAARKISPPSPSRSTSTENPYPATQLIDQQGLQRSLGLEREVEDLGFQEKSFDTCQVGYGYSGTQNCELQHFVVIHYRLQCRDSEGTVSKVLMAEDLEPIAGRDVKWTLPNRQGISKTDSSGFGQIRGIFRTSQRGQRLKLGTSGEFLYVRTNEISRIVTPKSWCPY